MDTSTEADVAVQIDDTKFLTDRFDTTFDRMDATFNTIEISERHKYNAKHNDRSSRFGARYGFYPQIHTKLSND
jgi:hypothetical protein